MRIKSLSYLLISSIFIKSIHAKNQCEILYDIINEITDSIQDFTKVSDVNMDCCDLDFIGCADEDGSKIITNIELNGERFKFVNQIPESLTNLSNLERIGITKVNNGGIKIPDFLSKLKNLNTLELMENYLEKDFPDAVIKISSLKTLYIKNNNIGGNIPESIDELSELEYLYIRNNLIKGKIPKSIGNLKNIKEIHLDNNLLEGEIPKSIGDLTHIKKLHLNGNKLTEKIPESIGELENLESLDLSENSLTGLIPDSIENLKKLKYLNLSKNKLNDVIDFSGNLPELSKIDLSESGLYGIIPNYPDSVISCEFKSGEFCIKLNEKPSCSKITTECSPELLKKVEEGRSYRSSFFKRSGISNYILPLVIILVPLIILAIFLKGYNIYSLKKEDDLIVKHIDRINSKNYQSGLKDINSDTGSDELLLVTPDHRKLSRYGTQSSPKAIFSDSNENDDDLLHIEREMTEYYNNHTNHTTTTTTTTTNNNPNNNTPYSSSYNQPYTQVQYKLNRNF